MLWWTKYWPLINKVSTVRFPLSISTGSIPSTSACIICSQELVECGITKPNLKNNYSISCPFSEIFCNNWKSFISSSDENYISLATSLHFKSSFGKWTYYSSSPFKFQSLCVHRTFPFSASLPLKKSLTFHWHWYNFESFSYFFKFLCKSWVMYYFTIGFRHYCFKFFNIIF